MLEYKSMIALFGILRSEDAMRLTKWLKWIQQYRLKPGEKCQFGVDKVWLLGTELSVEGRKPDQEKVNVMVKTY